MGRSQLSLADQKTLLGPGLRRPGSHSPVTAAPHWEKKLATAAFLAYFAIQKQSWLKSGIIGNHPRQVGCPSIQMDATGGVAEKVAVRQSHVGYGGWMCCYRLRSIGQRQGKSSFLPYFPATVLMIPQKGSEIFFVGSWPAARVSRWEESCNPLPGDVAPGGPVILPHFSPPPTKSDV
jgi:hypothetical protein